MIFGKDTVELLVSDDFILLILYMWASIWQKGAYDMSS